MKEPIPVCHEWKRGRFDFIKPTDACQVCGTTIADIQAEPNKAVCPVNFALSEKDRFS